jgi:hypothetical protein
VARCGTNGAELTAALLDAIPGTVFNAGDNAYPTGSAEDYRLCYEPTWGRHKSRTNPSPGNHEYETAGAGAYFDYFGGTAGPVPFGYYSFSVGSWLVVSLNSNIEVGSTSPQANWLRTTLQQNPMRCVAAIWHHPFVSSGPNGNTPRMRAIWRILQDAGADVVISAHDHLYERYAPLDADGQPTTLGLRQFVVGTGGAPLSMVQSLRPGSEVQGSAWGVLKLTLRADSYEWEFIPVPGPRAFHDDGRDVCH